jgi:hypothetical protein
MNTTVETQTQQQRLLSYRLCRKRRDTGEYSLRELSRRMRYPASPSTLHRALQGETLPAWPVIESLLVDGFGVATQTVRTEWLPLWVAAKDAQDPIATPAELSAADTNRLAAATPTTCSECGLPVADPGQHSEFHERYVPVTDTATRSPQLRLA